MATETLILKLQVGDTERKLKGYQQSLTKTDLAARKLQGDLPKTANAIRGTGKAAGTATGNIQRMGVAFRTTIGPIVAVYGAINLLNKSLAVASEREVLARKLAQGMKNLGATSSDLEALANTADRLGKATLFDQEDFTKAFTLLTSFRRIGTDAYERVAVAAADMSSVIGTDVNSSLIQLSKALEDPARRVTDLSRSGTVFTDQQKEQIKVLQESGRMLEAQDVILKEIEKQYGGAAKAAGKAGLAGALDSLGEEFRDLQTEIAGSEVLMGTLVLAINQLTKVLGEATLVAKEFNGFLEVLEEQLGGVELGFINGKLALEAYTNWLINMMGPLANLINGLKILRFLMKGYTDAFKDKSYTPTAMSDSYTGESPPTSTDLAPTLGGGKKTSKGGGKAKVNRVPELQAELALEQQLFALQTQINQAELVSDQKLAAELALKQNLLEIEADIAKVQRGKGTEAEKLLQIAMLQIKLEQEKLDAAHSIAIEEKERVESYKELMEGMNREIALLEEKDVWAKELLKIEHEILDLKKEGLLVTQKEIDAYREKRKEKAEAEGKKGGGKIKAYMDQLKNELEDTEGMIVSLAQTVETELGNAMSNAITGLIKGTKTAEEAFSEMFANIGKAFIDMASQMIAKALILKVLGVLMPGAGGGGNSIGAAAGAGSAGAAAGAAFADGGYVTGPTNALIGEGGDSEYVIPSQKMGEAMERYSGGMRGDAVIPGSGDSGGGMGSSGADLSTAINISGGVLNFNDDNYIKQDQIPAIINQASKSGEARTLSKLRSSSATRRRVGMA